MPPKSRKRPALVAPAAKKRARIGVTIKEEPVTSSRIHRPGESPEDLKERFIQLFSHPDYKAGVPAKALKEKFSGDSYVQLVPIINKLNNESRLVMSKSSDGELFYTLVSAEVASKFAGLDVSARMVYQVIERAGNMGIWTKDIRTQTNIQQQALNKIFKALETRQLIKPVKSVTAKAKKLYMLYNLTPSKELTGGVWYSDLEFDHEFISELRTFVLHCVRRLNGGKGVTLTEIKDKMIQAQVSRVQLGVDEVRQLIHTLIYDKHIEKIAVTDDGEAVYVTSRRVTPMCEFKWWESVSPDFQFRAIRFEDGIVLQAHEPHHQSS